MGDLFYFNFSGKNVLFKVTECQEHYLQGEFLFPYQFKLDHFSKSVDLSRYDLYKHLYSFIEKVCMTMDDLLEKIDILKKSTHQLPQIDDCTSPEKNTLLRADIEKFIEIYSNRSYAGYWGETLKNEVIDAFCKLLSGKDLSQIKRPESEYDDFFEKTIYKYRRYREVSAEGNQLYNYTLIERFLLETGYVNYTLKQTYRGEHHIPKKFIEICDADQYFQKEENRLPLIIGTQFGTKPPLSEEFKEKMEGQEAVILGKSQLSGYEHCLSLVIFKDGGYKVLNKVIN